ncbi:MAG: T9SS type A sorting domain-containing protein [Flavobacterium sp.]|uniref:T9SS type A sorting domain-containing protein n=1 Tax=Flavobacterium sp. TaxID=239 RepID=UPI00260B46B5|nr:T9SS type A sorting domain-containing protein [Flavobacterium sp.]MDD5149818.1 T9SS type A sorting domain-containing protein [Flavobacterium sp.]
MKKITFLFLALTGMFNVANAQMLFDFDTVNASHVFLDGWNGTWPNASFAKVANPDATGINTSANVGKFTANGGANAQLRSEDIGSAVLPNFDFATNPYLTMKVWVNKPISVTIEFQNNGYYPSFGTVTQSVTTINQWVTIEFNCTEFQSGGIHGWGTYNIVGVSFDKDLSGGTVANDVYYFDDMKLSATTTLSTKDFATNSDFIKVYPNPSASEFNVSKSEGPLQVNVFDVLGRKVATAKSASSQVAVGSSLKPGVYIVKVEGANAKDSKSFKVIKQ